LEDVAAAFLRSKGLEPEIYDDEEVARSNVEGSLLRRRYPLLLTRLDTEGEKPSETFVGRNETVIDFGMSSVEAVRSNAIDTGALVDFVGEIDRLVSDPQVVVDKDSIVQAVSRVLPEFHHLQARRTLDARM